MASAEELKAIQQLTQSIGREMDALSDKSDKRNKKLQQEADILKSITNEISSAEDAAEARMKIAQRIKDLESKNLGVNNGLKKSLEFQGQAAMKGLQIREKEFTVTEKMGGLIDDTADGMISAVDSLSNSIKQVPILGNIIAKPLEGAKSIIGQVGSLAKQSFVDGFFRARAAGKSFTQAFKGGMREMTGMLRAFGPMLANPYVLAAAAIAAMLGAGLVAFYKIEKAARAFRDETGLLNSQTQETEKNLNKVYLSTVGLGASMEDVAKAAGEFTNEFGGIEQPAENTIKSMIVLNKNFGVAIQDAAKVNKIFQNMAGVSEGVAQRQAEIVVELSKQSGVAPRAVMADIAESAEEAGGLFRGNTQEMIRQSVAAKAMGSSLKEITKVSKGLLDYQSSISAEMEASALLQTNLNFSQARYLAANGKPLEAQKEMVKQLRSRVNLEKASIFDREAIAKATNMEYDQILNMARIQERFGDLKDKELAAAQSLLKQGKDISKLSETDLANETQRLANQEDMQGKLESMGNRLSAIGSQLLQAFLPIGEGLVTAMEYVMPVIKGAVGAIGSAIRHIGKAFGDLVAPFKKIFGGGDAETFKKVLEVIGSILVRTITWSMHTIARAISGLGTFIGGLIDMGKGLWNIFKGFLSFDARMMMTGFEQLWEGIKGLFGGFLELLVSPFTAMYDVAAEIINRIVTLFKDSLSSLGESMMSIMPDWLVGSDEVKDGGSVKDGVIQNGKIITTDPSDTIIAAKNPLEALFGGMGSLADNIRSGVSNIASTSGNVLDNVLGNNDKQIIDKLEQIRLAVTANKDVYIDNERITSRVSRTQERLTSNKFGLTGA